MVRVLLKYQSLGTEKYPKLLIEDCDPLNTNESGFYSSHLREITKPTSFCRRGDSPSSELYLAGLLSVLTALKQQSTC